MLTNWRIGEHGAAALLDGRLPLTSLDLSGNPLGPAGILAIARAPRASSLEALAIAGVGIDEASVTAIVQTAAFANLRRLDLCGLPKPALAAPDRIPASLA